MILKSSEDVLWHCAFGSLDITVVQGRGALGTFYGFLGSSQHWECVAYLNILLYSSDFLHHAILLPSQAMLALKH